MDNLVISKKKRNLIIGISLSLIIMIIGTTYAYFTWQSTNNPIVNITIEDLGDVIFKGDKDIDITNIGPVLDYNDGEITKFYLKKKIEDNLDLSINITPTILPDNLKEESFKVKLLSSIDNITYNEVTEINFKDKEQDTKYELSIVELSQEKIYYKLIFYIDGNMYNPNTMKNNSFKAIIDVSVDAGFCKDTSGANAPVLAEGMIPITYDGTNWVKADTNKWYSYSCKNWANAVMVTTDKRETYMNANNNTVIPEEDILAYYVWIPRYKYKLFNATYTSGTSAQVIDVVFENGTSTTGTVTCTYASNGAETCQNKSNGNWYTHPAFDLGNVKLRGIWVGKFEVSGTTSAPRIKPGVTPPLRGISIGDMYNTSKLISSTNYITTDGVNKTDSHVMKNIEWGAVAYLKQSNYGLGITDIGINNNKNSTTGCGAQAGSDASTTCNTYNTEAGMLASTTGNITGVYDMSGGAWEYVMGNYNGTLTNSGLSSSTLLKQYLDAYAGTSISASHLGDAMGETVGWYNDEATFIDDFYPWFVRGSASSRGNEAGVFAFYKGYGDNIFSCAFHTVLGINE